MSSTRTILAIETSTLTAEVAIARGAIGAAPDAIEIASHGVSGANTHSEVLLGLVDAALRDAKLELGDVDAVAVGAGPGSFTGLRIGMAMAKGLAFATGRPLYALSSLAAMAMECHLEHHRDDRIIVPILDARRREVFIGAYRVRASRAEILAPESVMPPADTGTWVAALVRSTGHSVDDEPIVTIGSGFELYEDAVQASLAAVSAPIARVAAGKQTPSARAVAVLALSADG